MWYRVRTTNIRTLSFRFAASHICLLRPQTDNLLVGKTRKTFYGGATSYILQLISYYMEIIWDTGLTYLTSNKVTVHFRSFTGRIVAFHIPSSKNTSKLKFALA